MYGNERRNQGRLDSRSTLLIVYAFTCPFVDFKMKDMSYVSGYKNLGIYDGVIVNCIHTLHNIFRFDPL